MERHEVINIQTVAALEMEIDILRSIVADLEKSLRPDELMNYGRKLALENAISRMERCLQIAKGGLVDATVRVS
jgi:hypothetical protein